jgi:hypothetical protein
VEHRSPRSDGAADIAKLPSGAAADLEGHSKGRQTRPAATIELVGQRQSFTLWQHLSGQDTSRYPSPELPLLAGHESHRIIVSDAKGLRRRAELLLALANKARDDNYTQLADYILDRADQLFEEARIREFDDTETE